MTKQSSNICLFLIGFFSLVRVRLVGMIGVSEIPCILFGFFLFMHDYERLRRDGFLPLCWLWILTCMGSVFAPIYNGATVHVVLRGLAHPLTVFGGVILIYHLSRNNIDGLRWLVLGWSLSGITTFILHGGNMVGLMSDDPSGGGIDHATLRMYLFAPLVLIPVRCWYTKTPFLLGVLSLFAYGVYIALVSASGRSAALGVIAGAILLVVGGKSVRRMASIRKQFMVYVCLAVVAIFVAKTVYAHAAASGLMGEVSKMKYEKQTRGGDSTLRLLMGGRMQFFSGLFSALEKPLVGYGAWAPDLNDNYGRFLLKYGTPDDIEEHFKTVSRSGKMRMVDAHSHIIGFWLSAGIFGLILWLYILNLILQFFRKYVDAIPQWYGMLATMLPPFLWDIFFSPLYHRLEVSALLCMLLYVRSVARGNRWLPIEMQWERNKYLP